MESQQGNRASLPTQAEQKVTDMRNVREISRALQCLKDTLRNQLACMDPEDNNGGEQLLIQAVLTVLHDVDLGKQNNEIATSANHLMQTLRDLDAAARAVIEGNEAEMLEILADMEKEKTSEQKKQAETLALIVAEIDRRRQWGASVAAAQQELDDQLVRKESVLQDLDQLLSFTHPEDENSKKAEKKALEKDIASDQGVIRRIVSGLHKNEQAISMLGRYKNALEMVGNPPLHLVGQAFEIFAFADPLNNKEKN